jgi:hypothetical protein
MEERLKVISELSEKVIVNGEKEKKKRCTTCKKKKEIIMDVKEPVVELEQELPPSLGDIKLAYAELTSYGGVKEDKKPFISSIYNKIFNEELEYDCRVCVSTQVRKFTNYINKMNISV